MSELAPASSLKCEHCAEHVLRALPEPTVSELKIKGIKGSVVVAQV